MKIVFRRKAGKTLFDLIQYGVENGFPENAIFFVNEIYNFALTLGTFPNKYPICKEKAAAKRLIRCVTYRDYVFMYKVINNQLVIIDIIHGSWIK